VEKCEVYFAIDRDYLGKPYLGHCFDYYVDRLWRLYF